MIIIICSYGLYCDAISGISPWKPLKLPLKAHMRSLGMSVARFFHSPPFYFVYFCLLFYLLFFIIIRRIWYFCVILCLYFIHLGYCGTETEFYFFEIHTINLMYYFLGNWRGLCNVFISNKKKGFFCFSE